MAQFDGLEHLDVVAELHQEQVAGALGGRSGTFSLAVKGEHRDGVAATDVEVVAGSGTGELAGLRGSGHYAADAMTYTMVLDYDYDYDFG
ncbi:MAG: DUF3224 domain-containing protein [Jatrophihabitantaceae bacterium]